MPKAKEPGQAPVQFYYNLEGFNISEEQPLIDWLVSVAEFKSYKISELSYVFVDDEYLLEINQKFLEHDYYTDIITFNYNEGSEISGECFISIDRVRANANTHNESFNRELARVMVHGLLHLTGLDDKSEVEKLEMRKEEEKHLSLCPNFNVPRET